MLKVVYFDEGSAMDFISIKNGGNLIEETVKAKKTGSDLKGEAGAGVAAGKGIKRLLDTLLVDVDGKIGFDGSLFREKSNFIQSSLSNTILTDFIQVVNRQRRKKKEIEKLEGYTVEFVEESIAYFQRISPYLAFTDGELPLGDGINMSVNKLQEALKVGKGYYELLAVKDDPEDEIVLRFNNLAFRNNYSVADLDQMDLVFYGIKVGKIDKDLLNFENLMGVYSNTTKDVTKELTKGLRKSNPLEENNDEKASSLLDVYDLILAGVE